MNIGFTGTREGMNAKQAKFVWDLLLVLQNETQFNIHHGDCIGSDEQFHSMAVQLGADIYIHPPENRILRAFCSPSKIIFPVKPYLERDKDIVQSSDLLIATPKEQYQQIRSGTWFTYKWAQKMSIPTLVVYP